jgi:hypothetical protein
MDFCPASGIEIMKRILLCLVSVFLTACFVPSEADVSDGRIESQGQVRRGEDFEWEIAPDLTFQLRCVKGDGEGWVVWVGDLAQPEHDFSLVVTPPFRGMNARYIEGWHFRNGDNSRPNEGSVNAPQEIRGFSFVLNEADYETADRVLNCLLWPCDDLPGEEAIKTYEGLVKGTGVMTITHLDLGNLMVNERAWIEYMEFEVELCLPPDCETGPVE